MALYVNGHKVAPIIRKVKDEQNKTMTLGSSAPATVIPDSGKALSSVTPSIDSSVIKAENIKKDVVMLGITGTHEGGITPTGNIALTATTSTQTGIDVTNYATASVSPTPSESKTVTTNGTVTPSSGKLLSSVVVNVPEQKEEQSKTLTLGSAAPSTVTPDSGKVLSSVPVSIDSTVIKAENIAQGATILGIAGTHSGGGGTKYGIAIDDFWDSFPNPNSVLDNNAPDLDMSSVTYTPAENEFSRYFKFARIRSFNSFVTSGIGGQNSCHSMFYNNRCVQFVRLNFNGKISGTYALYNPFTGAYGLKVIILGFTSLTSMYHAYMLGSSSGSNNSQLYSFKNDTITEISGTACASYFCGNQKQLQTVWLNALTGVSSTGATYQTLQYFASGCSNIIRINFPRLRQIGYTPTGNSYAQMKYLTGSSGKLLSYFYLPELTTIYCITTVASNGTFASSNVSIYYLPRLTTIAGTGGKYIFNANPDTTEFHFGKANQAAIEATTGYDTLWGRGAGAANVYFDLINDITCNGVVYSRHQYDDYQVSLVYNGVTYYRSASDEDANNATWQFYCWKDNNGNKIYTQNPIVEATEKVWSYTTSPRWDYNVLGNVTSSDVYYGWEDTNGNIIYTTNQWTPAVGDNYYQKAADGKSMTLAGTITSVA